MSDYKDVPKCFRITEEQDQFVKARCKEKNIKESVYLRSLIDRDRGKKPIEVYLEEKKLVYEINKIGNNINQIVRNNNTHIYNEAEKKKLFALMEKIKTLVYVRTV